MINEIYVAGAMIPVVEDRCRNVANAEASLVNFQIQTITGTYGF